MNNISGYAAILKSHQKDRISALTVTGKRQVANCNRMSAAETFGLQQISNGVHGCVQVGATGPSIHRSEVKINSTYDRQVLLTQKLLP